MDHVTSAVLDDPSYRVPPVGSGDSGLAWLRAHVVRFNDGHVHRRRRALVDAVLTEIADAGGAGSPTRSLLRALGLPEALEGDVAPASAAYQPHAPQSSAADAAADRLVAACGGRTEAAAARVCVLLQAHTATLALVEATRAGLGEPPVPFTRRVSPNGAEVLVDLVDAPFGRGPHRCPGRELALRLAGEVLA